MKKSKSSFQALLAVGLLNAPSLTYSQNPYNVQLDSSKIIPSEDPCCGCSSSNPRAVCDPSLPDCPATGSVFYSMGLGQDTFTRDFQFVQAAMLPTYNVQVSSLAANVRTFDEVVSFYKQSPTMGTRSYSLQYGQEEVIDDSYKRSSLTPDAQSDAEAIFDGNQQIRQILTQTRLTDVQDLSTAYADLNSDLKNEITTSNNQEGFVVRTWFAWDKGAKVGDFYTLPSSAPLATVVFYNPDGTTDNGRLNILRRTTHDGSSYKNSAITHYDNGLVWTSKQYTGLPSSGTVMRQIVNTKDSGGTALNYAQTRVVSDATLATNGTLGSLVTVSKSRQDFDDIGGVSRMVSSIEGYGTGAERETRYGYYDTPSNGNLHGRLKWRQDPDKDFVHYTYAFNSMTTGTIVELRPFKDYHWDPLTQSSPNQNQCVKRTTVLSAVGAPTFVYHPNDTNTGLVYTGYSSSNVSTSGGILILSESIHDGSGHLVKKTGYHNTGANKGKVAWEEHADGTATVYTYATGAGGEYSVTAESGAGDRNGVTAGSKMVTTYNQEGFAIEQRNYELDTTDVPTSYWVADGSPSVDSFGRPLKVTYNGNALDNETFEYGCCGLSEWTNRSGVVTNYYKDDLKRTYKTTQTRGTSVITTTVSLQSDGVYSHDGLVSHVQRSDGSSTLLVSKSWTHLNGESLRVDSPDQNGDSAAETTIYSFAYGASGGKTVTLTNPLNDDSETEYFVDGQIEKVSGDAVADQEYDYGSHSISGGGTWSKVTHLTSSGGTAEWAKTYSDRAGRVFKVEYPTEIKTSGTEDHSSREYYPPTATAGSKGKLKKSIDPDGVVIEFEYDGEGRKDKATQAMPGTAGNRVETYAYGHETDGDIGVSLKTTTTVNGKLVSTTLNAIDGLGSKSIGLSGTSLVQKTLPNATTGVWHETSTNQAGVIVRNYYERDQMTATTTWEKNSTPDAVAPTNIQNVLTTGFVTGTSYDHDDFGRMESTTDARTGDITYQSFTEAGSPTDVISNNGTTVTRSGFDKLGRTVSVEVREDTGTTTPSLSLTETSYNSAGQVEATWGDLTYARFYLYDEQGRMTELRTYKNLNHGDQPTAATTGSATTKWVYHSERGWLVEKNYHGETENGTADADYSYTAGGRLETRVWERGITTTYGYDQGMLTSVTYDDTVASHGYQTPDLAYTYDSFGRVTKVTADGNNHFDYGYDPNNNHLELLTEKAYVGPSRLITRKYDGYLRNVGYQLGTSSDPDSVHETTHTYDDAGRVGTVAYKQSGGASKTFTYGYQDESFGLIETIDGPVHDVTRHWEDHRNVLEFIRSHNKADTANFSKFAYDVNKLGQREDVDRSGDAFSSPVTVDWGYNDRGELITENHPTAARDNAYTYDAIGNRTESVSGTLTLSGSNYATNDQNQYTATPASPTANSVDFDDDGNLEDDGDKFLYEWDAENRLVALQTRSGVTPERRYEMKYDYLGRCYQKEELEPDGVDDWVIVATRYFKYDGWNRIEETNSSGSYHVEFCWGLDLSGSFQGAGGVGGLLLRNDTMNGTAGTPTYRLSYPTYDGNGNVSEYLDSTGAEVTHFEYDAFGNTIHKTDSSSTTEWFKLGTLDGVHRFSTKPRQSESGLYYYGYRYYDPVTGRWASIDPIGEIGGANLYGMVRNDTLNWWDFLGLNGANGWGYRERIRVIAWCDCSATVDCVRETPCDVEVYKHKLYFSANEVLIRDLEIDPIFGWDHIEDSLRDLRQRVRDSVANQAANPDFVFGETLEDGAIELIEIPRCPDGFEENLIDLSIECKCDLIIKDYGIVSE